MEGVAYKVCPACDTRANAEHRYCPTCGNDLSTVASVDGDPYVGMLIADRYRLDKCIGEGAMGRVYRATQVTLNKPFAIKTLHSHLMGDTDSHARFANEAHNSASLNHPNVVSVVDYGRTSDNIAFLVMEFVEGKQLEDIIAEEFPLSRERIIDLTLQILAALTEAHGLSILHRDLKPENIIVQQLRTHGELLKVLDFGIAKLMDEAPGQARPGLTSQGMVCGTPEYMSPEQARGFKLDGRSDLYAVGCILYQMLTGRPPFESESAVEILHKHIHEAPVPPSQLLGADSDPLEAVCMKALAKERDARFNTAAEFRDALVAAGSGAREATMHCTACDAVMKPDARFCSSCGAPAPDRAVISPGKRRSTRLSEFSLPANAGKEATAEMVVRAFPLPLAGRNHLYERARRALATPPPGVVAQALTGPPGVGKTRLCDEFAALAESMDWTVHVVAAEASGAAPPLWPVRRMVAEVLGVDPIAATTADLGRATNLVGLSFESLPGLAELFGLGGPANEAEYAVRRRECFASAVQALVAGGRGKPLMLVFDDIDHFDAASRQVLQRLCRASGDHAVLVIVTSSEKNLSWINAPVVSLDAIEADDVRELVSTITERISPNSPLPDKLAQRAPMLPLRLELELRLLALGVPLPEAATEAELIQQRIELLEPGERQALEAASVLGERLQEEDLAVVMANDPGAPAEWALDEALARLHITGLLMISGRGQRSFAHRRIRDFVYASIDPERRARLHKAAAQGSRVARYSVTVRAMHLLKAGDPEVVDVLVEAAQQATQSFDDRKAVSLYRAALRSLRALTATTKRDGKVDARESEITCRLAEVLRFTNAHRSAIEAADKALASGRANGHDPHLQRVLARALQAAGEPRKAVDAFTRALGPLIALGEPGAILDLYAELGKAYLDAGEKERALREVQEGLDMCTLGEGPRAQIDVSLWRYLVSVSDIHRSLGQARDALTWAEHALFQAERTEDPLGLLRAHSQMAWILRELNQPMLAEQHLARALDHSRHFGDRLTTAEILLERGRVRAHRGKLGDAQRYYDEALRLARSVEWTEGVRNAKTALDALAQAEN